MTETGTWSWMHCLAAAELADMAAAARARVITSTTARIIDECFMLAFFRLPEESVRYSGRRHLGPALECLDTTVAKMKSRTTLLYP